MLKVPPARNFSCQIFNLSYYMIDVSGLVNLTVSRCTMIWQAWDCRDRARYTKIVDMLVSKSDHEANGPLHNGT